MKRSIQNALDESLSSVHFDARDMHHVLRAVREQEAPVRKKRKALRLDVVLAVATCALVIAPLSLFALHARRATISNITTVAAHGAPVSSALPAGHEDTVLSTQERSLCDESAAIQAARACFEAQCDTTVFSFDEYAVDVSTVPGRDGAPPCYEVVMTSIYGNGCTFTVTVSAADGSVLSHSAPQQATVPAALDRECPEVQAWYDRYGERLTWPLDVQAEFSRRYEGSMQRVPGADDVPTEAVLETVQRHLAKTGGDTGFTLYLSLYAERAFADGVARYRVYAIPAGETVDSAGSCTVLTVRASDGVLESTQILPRSSL